MNKYPEIFIAYDFLTLLQILSTLQIESNDLNVVHNIYVCFTIMINKQEVIDTTIYEDKLTELWKIVGGNTIRYGFWILILIDFDIT